MPFRSLSTCILGEAAFCWHKRLLVCLCHGAGIGLRWGTDWRIQRPDRILFLGLGRQDTEQSTGAVWAGPLLCPVFPSKRRIHPFSGGKLVVVRCQRSFRWLSWIIAHSQKASQLRDVSRRLYALDCLGAVRLWLDAVSSDKQSDIVHLGFAPLSFVKGDLGSCRRQLV